MCWVSIAPGVAETLVSDLEQARVDLGDGRTATIPGEFVEPVHLQVVCRTLWSRLGGLVRAVTNADLAALGTVDESLVRRQRLAQGEPDPARSASRYGNWIADVIRPAESPRYQRQLAKARRLVAAAEPAGVAAPAAPAAPAAGTP